MPEYRRRRDGSIALWQGVKQMMRRAKEEFKWIIERLSRDGYRFASPDGPITEPEPSARDWINDYRKRGVYVPIVLEAWLTEVGTINLMGSHPDWDTAGYMFDEDRTTMDPLRTDAFVCEVTSSYVDYLYHEWQSLHDVDRPPFRIDFSPDYLHKANMSGGPPYQLETQRAVIDSLVLNERHCISFVGLVRLALRWNGFPGFEQIDNEGDWSIMRPDVI